MKNLTVILFENDFEFKEYSDRVCEKFANLPAEKEFCGIWGEILFNNVECSKTNLFIGVEADTYLAMLNLRV